MLAERTALILIGAVTHYIETARPVSSNALARALGLNVSPATIRSHLHELEEEGYMHQPHTSAGRVPTDRGYRFYVDHGQRVLLRQSERELLARRLHALQREYERLGRETSRLLARLAHTLAVSHLPHSQEVQESGLAEFLQHSPAENLGEMAGEAAGILMGLQEHWADVAQEDDEQAQVFIGQEIPFFPARHVSLIVRTVSHSPQGKIIVALIGPKRMAYQHHVSLLNTLAHTLES